jgi:hypothetical protein
VGDRRPDFDRAEGGRHAAIMQAMIAGLAIEPASENKCERFEA